MFDPLFYSPKDTTTNLDIYSNDHEYVIAEPEDFAKAIDIPHVMKVLGHKNINNTLVYTQLVDFGEDEYTVRVAHTIEDKQLIEAGFEYVTERDGYKIYRKRK